MTNNMTRTKIDVEIYVPTKEDFKRIDNKLTNFSKLQGGVDYVKSETTLQNDTLSAQVNLEMLSWGEGTITAILSNLEDNKTAVTELLEKACKTAEVAGMKTLIASSLDNENKESLITAGFKKTASINLAYGHKKDYYTAELNPVNLPNLPPKEKKPKIDLRKQFANQNQDVRNYACGFFIKKDGKLLGELISSYTPLGEIEIERLYVEHGQRGKNIGKQLTDKFEEHAKSINMITTLVASPTWQQGRVNGDLGFYERVGYERLVATTLNLNPYFNNKQQHNVTYKKNLQPKGNPIIDPKFAYH